MEINYDIILKYLCENKNQFSNKLNITQNSNKFQKFKKFFTNSFFRYGIQIHDKNNNNISFWTSLLFCLDKDYLSKSEEQINNNINSIKKRIINSYKNKLYKKNDITQIISDTSNSLFLDLITDFFKLNVIIFDFENENISIAYYGDYFNQWRMTIYLANYKDFWEPIIENNKKFFNITDDCDNILKKILLENINYYNLNIKSFTINDNFDYILKNENLNTDIDIDFVENNVNETFISSNTLIKNLSVNKLKKMKKNDIIKLFDDLSIDIKIERIKKNDLINILKTKFNLI